MIEENFSKMPTLSPDKQEAKVTEERVREVLKPFQEGLVTLESDDAKKNWLSQHRPDLVGEDLTKGHEELKKKAAEQIGQLGLDASVQKLLEAYYYVHYCIRYNYPTLEA